MKVEPSYVIRKKENTNEAGECKSESEIIIESNTWVKGRHIWGRVQPLQVSPWVEALAIRLLLTSPGQMMISCQSHLHQDYRHQDHHHQDQNHSHYYDHNHCHSNIKSMMTWHGVGPAQRPPGSSSSSFSHAQLCSDCKESIISVIIVIIFAMKSGPSEYWSQKKWSEWILVTEKVVRVNIGRPKSGPR